jgi:hypothetical protein
MQKNKKKIKMKIAGPHPLESTFHSIPFFLGKRKQ